MNPIAALLNKPKASSTELTKALENLNHREVKIQARINDIVPGKGPYPAGPERARLELEGEPADLVKLDAELAELRAELAAVPTKRTALTAKLQAAEATTAQSALPKRIKALPAALDAWQAAMEAEAKARAEVDATVSAITQQRRKVEDAGGNAPAVSDEVAGRYCDMKGHIHPDNPAVYNSARGHWFLRLTGRSLVEDTYKPKGERGSFEKDDRVDLSRQPEQSIWNKSR